MVNIATVREGFDLMERGMRKLASGPLDYYMKQLMECYELLIDRYAPFKVGDRVLLTETPEISSISGWYACRHFLVKNETGTVRNVEADGQGFIADVEFDNETWIPEMDHFAQGIKKGVPHPVTKKHTFRFRENSLAKI